MGLSEPGLDREEADRALRRLSEESDRIAEALLAMDNHPGHQLLRSATLTGQSRQRWDETGAAMATLWEQFAAYQALLDRARAVRARRSRPGQAELDELTELLTGPVVELNAQQVPIERRSLTGPALTSERITLAELVDRMKAGYAKITAVLAEADAAASAALQRIDPLEADLRAATARAELIGPDQLAALAPIRERIAEARRLAVSDPLALRGADPLGTAAAELAAITDRLTELSTVKESFDDRLARIAAVLDEIAHIQARARVVSAEARAKIAATGLPEIVDRTPRLRAELARLSTLRAGQDWPGLAADLDRLDRAAADARAQAGTELAAFAGLLDRRAELRGRLDAYRAKAEGLGWAENLELAALYREAHGLLHTAPCDLAAATRALGRYQQAIARTRQEGSR